MKKYTVEITRTVLEIETYHVEAESKDEALEMLENETIKPTSVRKKPQDRDSAVWETP